MAVNGPPAQQPCSLRLLRSSHAVDDAAVHLDLLCPTSCHIQRNARTVNAICKLKTLPVNEDVISSISTAMIALVSRARLQLSVPFAISRPFSSRSGGIDYDSFLSRSARARVPSPIR
jgi:hypothetical protein